MLEDGKEIDSVNVKPGNIINLLIFMAKAVNKAKVQCVIVSNFSELTWVSGFNPQPKNKGHGEGKTKTREFDPHLAFQFKTLTAVLCNKLNLLISIKTEYLQQHLLNKEKDRFAKAIQFRRYGSFFLNLQFIYIYAIGCLFVRLAR